MTVIEAALAFHDAGLCVLPAATDGTKRPGIDWKHYQAERPARALLEQWLAGNIDGIGAVCGNVSGGLEMLELEGRAIDQLADIATAAEHAGLRDLWLRVTGGYVERSPSGGVHWLYRVPGGAAPNTKLARNTAGDVTIETRGEGGWTILAPSGGRTHPTGRPWELVAGTAATIPTVTTDERDELHTLLRAFDEYRPAQPAAQTPTLARQVDPFAMQHAPHTPGDVTPGDDFARRTTWRDILEPEGWRSLFEQNGRTYWRRPGKTFGISATTGGAADGGDRLFVFSTSAAPFETEVPYTKLGAWAVLHHGGDHSAAARDLAQRGFGSRPDPFAVAAGVAQSAPAADGTTPTPRLESSLPNQSGNLEPAEVQRTAFEALVAVETTKLRVRDAATAQLRRERAGQLPEPIIHDLPDLLAQDDDPAEYRVDEVWPVGGRFLLAAQYKAGKSTMVANLLRSLVDDEPFLGVFKVQPFDGRIVLIDDELDVRMLRRWLREQGIKNAAQITVVSLRGRLASFDILDETCRAEWASRLRAKGAGIVLFDCLRPVLDSLGLDESHDAGRFLVAFDELLGAAGVTEAGVVHHAGHGGERSRGDSRLRDWPDVEWLLVREKDDKGESEAGAQRAFRAYGRDVDVPERILVFDPISRRLSLGDGNRKEFAETRDREKVLQFIGANPGATGQAIEDGVEGVATKRVGDMLRAWRDPNRVGPTPILWERTPGTSNGWSYTLAGAARVGFATLRDPFSS